MPVFDDNVWDSHPQDFLLLQHGHVHLVRHEWALDRLLTDLQALDYPVVAADFASCADADAARAAVIAAIHEWPADYGATTWPGFCDGLTDYLLDVATPQRVLVLNRFDRFADRNHEEAERLLDLLVGCARWHLLFGRRLICLVQTDNPELSFDDLGAEPASWNPHEWLLAHRMGERLPPWIAHDRAGD